MTEPIDRWRSRQVDIQGTCANQAWAMPTPSALRVDDSFKGAEFDDSFRNWSFEKQTEELGEAEFDDSFRN